MYGFPDTCPTLLETPHLDRFIDSVVIHSVIPNMFESIATSQLHHRQAWIQAQYVPARLITANIIDIRTDKSETQLRQSLEECIHATCHGEASMPELLLWDEKGLRYFEDVTYTPSYYLTNEEIALLEKYKYQIAKNIPSGSMLVELGSGYVPLPLVAIPTN